MLQRHRDKVPIRFRYDLTHAVWGPILIGQRHSFSIKVVLVNRSDCQITVTKLRYRSMLIDCEALVGNKEPKLVKVTTSSHILLLHSMFLEQIWSK